MISGLPAEFGKTKANLVLRVQKPAGEEYVQIFFLIDFLWFGYDLGICVFYTFLKMKPQLEYAALLGAHCALPVTTQPPLEDRKDPVLGLLFHIPGWVFYVGLGVLVRRAQGLGRGV